MMIEWLQRNRTYILIEGAIFTILGFLAIVLPNLATLSTELIIGWLLIFGGVAQLYRVVKDSKNSSFISSLIFSLVYIVFGILLILFPIVGMLSLTLVITAYFLIDGISKMILSYQLKNSPYRGWIFFSGLIALFMAFIIGAGWPSTGFWALGLLVGVNLIFFGISLLSIGFNTPKPPLPPSDAT